MASNKKNIFTGMRKTRHILGLIILFFLFADTWCKTPDLYLTSQAVSCHEKSDGSITINIDNPMPDKFEITLVDPLSKQVISIDQTHQLPYTQAELPAGVIITFQGAEGVWVSG